MNDAAYLYEPTNNVSNTYANNSLNQYTSVNGTAYSYDGNGNLTSDGTNTCAYDAENRLVRVVNGSYTLTNLYDGLGRRVAKTVNGVSTSYVYDGDQVIMEYNTSGQALRRYVYGGGIDEPICLFTTNAQYSYHFDSLGSVIALSSGSGAVAERYTYDAFGKPSWISSISNPYLYTGRNTIQKRVCTTTAPGFMGRPSGGSYRLTHWGIRRE